MARWLFWARCGLLLVFLAACDSRGTDARAHPMPAANTTQDATAKAAVARDPTRLPEDEAAGKRAEAQWREHLAEEEHERQLGFDHRHLEEHLRVVRLLDEAQKRYDSARTKKAVERARSEMARRCADVRRRVERIDPWGNNSRLLSDYAALTADLEGPYADAKRAALEGDDTALKVVRARFAEHRQIIARWLEEAAEEERDAY